MADEQEVEPARSPWRAMIGLVLVIGLVAVIWLVMGQLYKAAKIQDCVASGRTNCAPISTSK